MVRILSKDMDINQKLLNEIKAYCKSNGIKSVGKFVNSCLEQGFNIAKYGVSPFDNIAKCQTPVEEKQEPIQEEAALPSDDKPIKRRGIKITKKS